MTTAPIIPREIAGVRIPDSRLAARALAHARALSAPVVFNHALRTFVLGSLAGRAQGLGYDEELFFLGAVLHDLGLTDTVRSTDRFEVAGADAAAAFLAVEGVPEERREIVWDAIALHTSVGIASRKRPEIALVHIGAGMDVLGLHVDALPDGILEETVAALPRLNFKQGFPAILLDVIGRNPAVALTTWMEPLARAHVPGFCCPSFLETLRSSGFGE